jgi:hypothetical protein
MKRALAAIVVARLRAERRTIVYVCATAAVAGLARPHEPAAPVFFCCALGIVAALLQTPGRYPDLDVCEESAPLFGRHLARAKGAVPSVVAAFVTLAYFLPRFAAGEGTAVTACCIALAASLTSTTVALGATLREGTARTLYVALACAAGAAADAVAGSPGSLIAELAFCAIVTFFALRQYGEALARFDPVPP